MVRLLLLVKFFCFGPKVDPNNTKNVDEPEFKTSSIRKKRKD